MENVMSVGDLKQRETIDVDIESRMTGRVYKGSFTWRRRKLDDLGKISQYQSALTNGADIVDKYMADVLRAVAELSVVVEDYPKWWEEVKELNDIGVIVAVHARYLEWLSAPFRKEREERQRERSGKSDVSVG